MKDKVTVLIVDDHEIARVGLSMILKGISIVEVLGAVENSFELFKQLDKEVPDIIFMDLFLEGENGVEVTRKVLGKYPGIYVIAFTSSEATGKLKEMIDAGATGFLIKNVKSAELKTAIEEIACGNMYFSKEFSVIAKNLNPRQPNATRIILSDREKEVLLRICKGLSNQEIAKELNLSFHTIDIYRRNLLTKTGAKNTASMIAITLKNRIIDID